MLNHKNTSNHSPPTHPGMGALLKTLRSPYVSTAVKTIILPLVERYNLYKIKRTFWSRQVAVLITWKPAINKGTVVVYEAIKTVTKDTTSQYLVKQFMKMAITRLSVQLKKFAKCTCEPLQLQAQLADSSFTRSKMSELSVNMVLLKPGLSHSDSTDELLLLLNDKIMFMCIWPFVWCI